jgi:hypothetical protein
MENTKRPQSFTQPKSFRFVANHGEKVFYVLCIIGVFYTYQDLKGQFLIDVIILVSILFLILYGVKIFLLKVIWRFDVDFDQEKITFYLCRNTMPIHLDFRKIDQIKVSGPIVFLFDKKKLYYSTNQYTEVLKTLQQVKQITWGKMCNLLGPKESIRKIVEKGQ